MTQKTIKDLKKEATFVSKTTETLDPGAVAHLYGHAGQQYVLVVMNLDPAYPAKASVYNDDSSGGEYILYDLPLDPHQPSNKQFQMGDEGILWIHNGFGTEKHPGERPKVFFHIQPV